MKIFLFCIMIMSDGAPIYYKYSEGFASQFECNDRARIERSEMANNPTDDIKSVELMCATSDNFVEKFVGAK